MNRLRHGYLEIDPTLEPYFTASANDDLDGALQTLGIDHLGRGRSPGSPWHLFQTLPGMLTVLVGAIAGAIGALVAVAIGVAALWASLIAVVAFVVFVVWMGYLGQRSSYRPSPSLEPRVPSPDE